ncbi:MAG TPA: hypothetical protein VGC72_12320 [Candidatus Elarobacter sp.]
MRRLIVCALIAGLGAPAIVAVPIAASAEPAFCAGLRKKATLQRWELEAFSKGCADAARAPAAKQPNEVVPAQNVVTAASLVGDPSSTSTPQTDREALRGAVPDKNGFLRVRASDVKAAIATNQLQKSTAATTDKTVVQAETKAAAATTAAAVSANVARSADQRLSVCRYKANWLTFVAGLVSLARAPKIRDGTQFLALAAPLPFSPCEKAVDAASSPLVVPASIGLIEGGDAVRLHVLESNYTGSFAVTPADAGIVSVTPVFDADKKTVLRDQFDVKALKFSDNTSLNVQDESGALKVIHVTITKKASS